tara:strand:- start:650 stop:1171 length:522 start_codon:yes stop_codon:yes gene_type:complete
MSKSNKKQLTVLVDTSFLIFLSNPDLGQPHETAKKYYKYFLKHNIQMKLSTIAATEFHQVQSIIDIISTDNYQVLPYNLNDAIRAADIAFGLGGTQRINRDKDNIKYMDDIKLLGQAASNNIDFIITHDKTTLAKYANSLNKAGIISTKPIDINEPFDASHFNGGQSSLDIGT